MVASSVHDKSRSRSMTCRKGGRPHRGGTSRLVGAAAAVLLQSFAVPATSGPALIWSTVVNNTISVPDDADPSQRNFNSYNQPSVNDAGYVVFRARSKGGQSAGEPASGIFTRDMGTAANPINTIASRNSAPPMPAYTDLGNPYSYALSPNNAFNEFPSIPRIDKGSNTIATRGQSQPVVEITDSTNPSAPVKTKAVTSAVYTNPGGTLTSGVVNFSSLGFDRYQVPGQPAEPSSTSFRARRRSPTEARSCSKATLRAAPECTGATCRTRRTPSS